MYWATLARAAWLHIHYPGNPNKGCSENRFAWENVMERFPGLDGAHLIMALNHAHLYLGRLMDIF